LNGVGARRSADQIRAAIVSPPPTTSTGAKDPMPSYDKKITAEDLNSLVEYLRTLPASH
jgi:aldose sugar dehydrogenase